MTGSQKEAMYLGVKGEIVKHPYSALVLTEFLRPWHRPRDTFKCIFIVTCTVNGKLLFHTQ